MWGKKEGIVDNEKIIVKQLCPEKFQLKISIFGGGVWYPPSIKVVSSGVSSVFLGGS